MQRALHLLLTPPAENYTESGNGSDKNCGQSQWGGRARELPFKDWSVLVGWRQHFGLAGVMALHISKLEYSIHTLDPFKLVQIQTSKFRCRLNSQPRPRRIGRLGLLPNQPKATTPWIFKSSRTISQVYLIFLTQYIQPVLLKKLAKSTSLSSVVTIIKV